MLDVANSSGYESINNLDMRANYFGSMYAYTKQPWFRAAENLSRSWLDLKSANILLPDWVNDAGNVIMKRGKSEFQYIYRNKNEGIEWSKKRLHNEQLDPNLQEIHKKHYDSWKWSWKYPFQFISDHKVSGEFLNSVDRIKIGCEKMPEVRGCNK